MAPCVTCCGQTQKVGILIFEVHVFIAAFKTVIVIFNVRFQSSEMSFLIFQIHKAGV